jgi:hypothetical protein
VTGNSPLLTFNIQQDEATVRVGITNVTSGAGKRLKRSSTTKTVEVEAQAKGEIRRVKFLLNLTSTSAYLTHCGRPSVHA